MDQGGIITFWGWAIIVIGVAIFCGVARILWQRYHQYDGDLGVIGEGILIGVTHSRDFQKGLLGADALETTRLTLRSRDPGSRIVKVTLLYGKVNVPKRLEGKYIKVSQRGFGYAFRDFESDD